MITTSVTSPESARAVAYASKFNLTVAKHTYAATETPTSKLSGASNLLRDASGLCYDSPTCITLAQQGSTGTFYIRADLNIINGNADLSIVGDMVAVPYNVKIVDDIFNINGSAGHVLGSTVLGSRNAVIIAGTYDIVWAHEFGHMKGLVHDDGCEWLIMNSSTDGFENAVTIGQGTTFVQNSDGADNSYTCGLAIGNSLLATGTSGGVTLTWTESEPGSVPFYSVSRSMTCWGPYVEIAQIAGGDPVYTVDGTRYIYADGTASYVAPYYYRVTTIAEQVEASAVPLGGLPSAPPAALAGLIAHGYIDQTGAASVTLDWTNGGGSASGFYVYRAPYAGMATCAASHGLAGEATATSFVDVSAPGTGIPVSYRVVAYNASGASEASAEVIVERKPVLFTVRSNQPGVRIRDGEAEVIVGAGGYSPPCSTFARSATRQLSVNPTQEIGGTHFCYDGWSEGGAREHTVTVLGDTTITVNVVPSGTGSAPFSAGANLPQELTDCRGPYKFLGDAYAIQGLTIYPGTKIRFPRAGGGAPYAGLSVSNYLVATEATFETADSTETGISSTAWSGITVTGPWVTQLAMSRCTFRNATIGIVMDALGAVSTVRIDSCSFEKNTFDMNLQYLHSSTPGKTLTLRGNYFKAKNAVQVTGATFASDTPIATMMSGNTFAGTISQSKWLRLSGGFTGEINSNVFNMSNSGNIGVELNAIGQYPNVSLTGNYFQFATTQRTSLIAPDAAGHPYLLAYNNSWNLSTAGDIEKTILHFDDTMSNNPPKAEVIYEPFTAPGGGGGGGGGGCPFVLSRQVDGSYALENSILGASEALQSSGAFVRDAYPLERARISEDGIIHLRIAELERETDFFDRVALEAVVLPEGAQVGVDPNGVVVAYRPANESAVVVGWSGRNAPFVSPIATGNAYTGEPGDSLELLIPASGPNGTPISRRFYISMIPKPTQAPGIPSSRVGVVVRIASDKTGSRWDTSQPLVPRALWSNAILPVELPASGESQRIRIVWNTQHSLGWVGVAEVVEPTARVALPFRSATHSTRGEVIRALAEDDGESARLEPGEYVDLAFDGRTVPQGARLVLTARGRYQLGGAVEAVAPAAAYADQNRPNPFNPHTEIRFGLPRPGHVRITIFDVAGRRVRTLLDRDLPAGHHVASWDGTDVLNRPSASGVYFYQMSAGDFTSRKRMVLVR